jgi:hypothetical protein
VQWRKAPNDESAASLRRGGKSVIPRKDDSVANLPGSTSGGSKPTYDKDDSAAPLRKGGKSVIPAKRDDLANLPTSTLEGSKSSDQPDGGRFVAIRGTGNNAPGSADRRNPRPSWPSGDETMANLPISTLEGSKSNEDPDGWRVVAIRGTGSRAPGSTDGHNPRSSIMAVCG